MNIFNRVVMVVLLLLALAVSVVFTIIPLPLLDLVSNAVSVLAQSVERARLVSVLIGIGLTLLWFLFLVLELWRPPKRTVRVEKVSGGRAEMTVDAIAQRVVYRVDQLADVGQGYAPGASPGADYDIALDTEALRQAFLDLIDGTRNCLLAVDAPIVQQPGDCEVTVDGVQVYLNEPNGWRLEDSNTIELLGNRCTALLAGDNGLPIWCNGTSR